MKSDQPQDDSYPFLLRIWKEEVEGGGSAWAGRLQHIVKGNAHLFRTWAGLIDLLEADLQDVQDGSPSNASDGDGQSSKK
ncbi:MAG: hypothetical protein ABI670_11195 [Chloroflexota bacterium]